MIILTLQNSTSHLNVSLQVGDLIYARTTGIQGGSNDSEQGQASPGAPYATTNFSHVVGVLRKISNSNSNKLLYIDDTAVGNPYVVGEGDFIMFSKYNQSMGDVIGYYAKARFVNNSTEKAEIFSVGSEVIINSK